MNKEKYIKLVIDQHTVDRYSEYYFKQYPRRHKPPIDRPIHPLMNSWMILRRPEMNALKQKWKDFIIWFVTENNCENMCLDKFIMKFTVYMPTKRRVDCDGLTPKFILDGFTDSHFIIDDSCSHLRELRISADYDKYNPRTEIEIYILE